MRVVVIEDDDDGRMMLATWLRARGLEVITAGDGPNGLETILAVAPDIAIIDIGLPRMSGLEVGRRTSEIFGDEIRLIAVTGFAQRSDSAAAFAAGFHDYFSKPLVLRELAAALADPGRRVTLPSA